MGLLTWRRLAPLGRLFSWRALALGAILLLFLLRSAALIQGQAVRGLEGQLLLPAAAGGLVVAWALAGIGLEGRSAWSLGLSAGAALVTVSTGGLAGRLASLALLAGRYLFEAGRRPLEGLPDAAALAEAWRALLDAGNVLLLRVGTWGGSLLAGEPSFDPVAAALVWGWLLWLLAFWAGWGVFRWRRPLLASLPIMAVTAGTLAYIRGATGALYPVLAGTLLAMALVHQDDWERSWSTRKISFPEELGRNVTLVAMVVVTMLLVLAALAPSFTIERLSEAFRNLTEPETEPGPGIAESLGLRVASAVSQDPFSDVRSPGLPRDLLIGSGPELSEEIVMIIFLPEGGPVEQANPPPLYWRSLTFDIYTGHGWRTSGTQMESYEAGAPATELLAPSQQVLRQEVRVVEPGDGLLYTSGQLVSASVPYTVAWRPQGDPFGATMEALRYEALSRLPIIAEGQLRSAGERYPDWVRERYLRLPSDLPPRVTALALELTAAERTPYDRARALERYLRTFTYNLDIPRHPIDRDVADYFLFELQQGYCDYYATAMVVLARAAGIPARLAVGYASGRFDAESNVYLVSKAEAHSWVEIYFPGVGWVPFEPTAGRPAIERAEALAPIPPAERSPTLPGAAAGSRWPASAGLALLAGLGVALLAGTAWLGIDGLRLRRLDDPDLTAVLLMRLRRSASAAGAPLKPGDTPLETAGALSTWLRRRSGRIDPRWQALILPTAAEAGELIQLAIDALFRARRLSNAERAAAQRLLLRLRFRLTAARLAAALGMRRPFGAGSGIMDSP